MIKQIRISGEERDWTIAIGDADVRVDGDDRSFAIAPRADGRYDVVDEAATIVGTAAVDADTIWVDLGHDVYQFHLPPPGGPGAGHAFDALMPPMPATVVRVNVKAGDEVKLGDVLVVLEAMKMELPIRAPHDGTVQTVECQPGDLVQPGQVLIRV
jgi:biotin carboxyl carrier protein